MIKDDMETTNQLHTVLKTNNLAIGYSKRGKETIVQQSLNLTLQSGELVSLIGQNGCGKSTLLRTLSTLQPSISGEIFINDTNVGELSIRDKAKMIALVLTDRVEIENAKVIDVVRLGQIPFCKWYSTLSKEAEELVKRSLQMVRMEHKANSNIAELSDGELQRVMIAKALAQETPIIFLDEPTAHLDLPNRVEIMILLRKLANSTGKTVVISTHELDLALQTSDKIWLMDTRNGVEIGTPKELIDSGSFSKIFQSNSYTFDFRNGGFHVDI